MQGGDTVRRVAYLGPPGTFSHEALTALAGAGDWLLEPAQTIHATVLAVQDGWADRSLVPIENSLEGSVNATLDALAMDARDVEIAGELLHPVHHCLVTTREMELEEIRVVVSHPQGTAQCAEFLRRELPSATVQAAASTAGAVSLVAERPSGAQDGAGWAAIGSRAAADRYGGHVLRTNIEDVPGNETRFAWLAPVGSKAVAFGPGDSGWKTAIVWWGTGSGSPGWLVRCLSEFAFRGVNLTRIESRPRREAGLGEYRFFADLQGRATDPAVETAIAGLGAHAATVRVLGSFPAAS